MIRTGSVAFLIGITVFHQLPVLPTLYWLLVLPLVLAILLILPRSKLTNTQLTNTQRHITLICCAIICGFLWTLLRATMILNIGLNTDLKGNTVMVEGQVIGLPKIQSNSVYFEFHTDKIVSAKGHQSNQPMKLRLHWYSKTIKLQPGQYWQLHVRLKQPYSFSNPGGLDYEAWLFRKRIRATGYIVNKADNQLLSNTINQSPITSIDRLRYQLRSAINQANINEPERSLIIALSLGDRSQLLPATQNILRQTGTSHLLAISGLHIGLVFGFFFIIGRWLWALSIYLPHHLPSQRFATFAALLAAIAYAALAGFSIPTQRALIMLTIWVLGALLDRKFLPSDIIATALLAILLIDPFAVMDTGFWLSFIAISTIAYGMIGRTQTNITTLQRLWLQWGKVQYIVAIGLLPILILWLNQYPLFSIIANIIAIPYVSLLVIPLILTSVTSLFLTLSPIPINLSIAEFFLHLAAQALLYLWSFLHYLSSIDMSIIQLPTPSPLTFTLAIIGILAILAPRGIFPMWLGYIWLLPLLFTSKPAPEKGEFWLTQLDVGQGLATVIQTQNHALIYDAGDKFSPRFNTGQAVVIPFLQHHQITKPDIILASHGDRDHIGGVHSILKAYPDIKLLTNATDKLTHTHTQPCIAGMHWHWDGIDFEILSPAYQWLKATQNNTNNSSCVLKISNPKQSALLTGDIEQESEKKLIKAMPEKLAANILIAPHHGSKTSSSSSFIDAVSPQTVVFPVGYKNRFGFPKQAIIKRYQARQITILNTARDGAITFKLNGQKLEIYRHRQQNQRFWHSKY